MSEDHVILVMAKNPVLGKVKTRLAEDIGDDAALRVYNRLLSLTNQVIQSTGLQSAVFYTDHITKDVDADYYGVQPDGNLGERMSAAFSWAFSKGFSGALMIGTDCPELSSEHLMQAAKALEEKDLVFGPANDGGYYLIGMNGVRDTLLTDIPWSTEQVLSITLTRASDQGLSYRLLEELTDIDDLDDLKSMEESLSGTSIKIQSE